LFVSLKEIVRTTNKSMDAIPAAWLRRNVFHPLGGRPLPPDHTAPWLIGRSRASAVRRGFAALPTRTSPCLSVGWGRGARGRFFGATTASGFPTPIGAKAAPMPPDHGLGLDHRDRIQNRGKHRYSQTKVNRSMFRSRIRDGDLRLKMLTR
jgi:hypothetical protein